MKLMEIVLISMKGCKENKRYYSVGEPAPVLVKTLLARLMELDSISEQVEAVSIIFRITPSHEKKAFCELHHLHKSCELVCFLLTFL